MTISGASDILSGIGEISDRLGVGKTKASELLKTGVVPSLVTGGEHRAKFTTSNVLIKYAEKIIQHTYGENAKPFSYPIAKEELIYHKGDAWTYAIGNQKGGVGKTTTTVNLAASLAELGQKVLLVDVDPQAQTSKYLKKIEYNKNSILNLMMMKSDGKNLTKKDVQEYIVSLETNSGGNTVDLLPSEVRLGRTMETMRLNIRPEMYLKEILSLVKDEYDFILIDTPPSAGLALQQGIIAADKIILVSEADEFSVTPLEATIEEIEILNRYVEDDIEVDAIIVNKYKNNELVQQGSMQTIVELLVEKLNLDEDGLVTIKYASSIVKNSQAMQLPILAYKKEVKKTLSLANPFFELASKMIIQKITTAVVTGN